MFLENGRPGMLGKQENAKSLQLLTRAGFGLYPCWCEGYASRPIYLETLSELPQLHLTGKYFNASNSFQRSPTVKFLRHLLRYGLRMIVIFNDIKSE